MPVLLDKPFNPGDADPKAGEGYPFAQLTGFVHNGLTLAVSVEYEFGTASGDYYEVWERGAASPTKQVFVEGADVAQIWARMPESGECVGEAIRRCTYEFLINSGKIAGKIQNNPPLPPAQAPVQGEAPPVDAPAQPSEGSEPEATPEPEPTPASEPEATPEPEPAPASEPEAAEEPQAST